MRLRIGVEGNIYKIIPVKWTLVAENVPTDKELYALWICAFLNGKVVKAGILNGTVFANMT